MATATAPKKRKKRTNRGRSLAGFPAKNQLVPILKAVGMLTLGVVGGYAVNDMIDGMYPTEANAEGFNVKGLIAPLATVAGGMFLIGNPTTKYLGLGLSAAGALKTVSTVMKKDVLTLPELRFIKSDKAALPASTTPVKGMGLVPYLEFDDEDDEDAPDALPQNANGFDGFDGTDTTTFL